MRSRRRNRMAVKKSDIMLEDINPSIDHYSGLYGVEIWPLSYDENGDDTLRDIEDAKRQIIDNLDGLARKVKEYDKQLRREI